MVRTLRFLLALVVVTALGVQAASPDAAGRSQTGLSEVRKLNQAGQFGEAERRARALLADVEQRLGPDSLDVAMVLVELAQALRGLGNATGTRDVLQRAATIREKILGPEHPLTAATFGSLGMIVSEYLGDPVAARPIFERAVKAVEAAPDPNDPALASLFFNAGRNRLRLADSSQARRYFERALGILQKQPEPDGLMVGNTMTSLAISHQNLGEYAAAAGRFKDAIAILARYPQHEWYAFALNNFGLLQAQLGDYAQARDAYENAFGVWNGKGSPQASAPLNNLAIIARRTGDFLEAKQLYERSLAIREKAYGVDHVDVALVLNNLGNLAVDLGDYEDARRRFERAIAIRVQKLKPDHPLVASSRYGLANALAASGQQVAAQREFNRALATWRKLPQPSPELAEGLRGLARFLEASGRPQLAAARLREALAILENAYGPDHLEVGMVLGDLANVESALGALDKARTFSERALPILEGVLGSESQQAARILVLQASLHLRQGEVQASLEKALRSESIGRERFQLTARALSERQALEYSNVRTSGMSVAASALVARPSIEGAAALVHDALIRSRALVLDEIASWHRRPGVSELTDAEVRLASARQRLANIIVRGPEGRPEPYRQMLDQARLEKDAAEIEVASLSLPFRSTDSLSRVGLTEARAALPAGAALVSFFKYDRRFTTGAVAPAYGAFVSRVDGQERFAPLGAAAVVEAAVQRWRDAARAPTRTSTAREASYRVAGSQLRAMVWDPVAAAIGDATQVFIVPDGALNFVTFASLPVGTNAYLVETGPLLHYLSAERDLVQPPEVPEGRGIMVVGDPAFDEAGAQRQAAKAALRGTRLDCVEFERLKFEPLPGTGLEINDVADLWRRSAAAIRDGATMQRLTGVAAKEAVFKDSSIDAGILHLATHGFFLSSRCGATSSQQRGVGGVSSSTPSKESQANPLLLSGLVLAGANRRGTAGIDEDDGILTAEEIASLDLRKTHLVVLSACDTGVGEIRRGEGVFGLRRAFRVAGARTVVMSLWSVDDAATRSWMTTFYDRRLMQGRSIAESVREADLARLGARRAAHQSTHPFYWTGFVAAGDWR